MSLQSQYVIGLYRDVNPTKNRCATISRAHWVLLNSIKEINRLREEINRLLSKGMLKIYLKVTTETKLTFSKLRFLTRADIIEF